MSDMEFFNAAGGAESYDPAALERFKEQMKKNAAFMAAARKGEQKQKQKEDRLAKILLKFIQSNQKSGILLLAARLLEENIPASFILSIILLGNEEIQAQLKAELSLQAEQVSQGQEDLPQIPASAGGEWTENGAKNATTEFSLITRFTDQTMPLKIKVAIDEWGKGIFEAGSAVPFRVLETALGKDGELKRIVIDCSANVLEDFMNTAGGNQSLGYDTFFSFCEFLMRAVMKRLKEQIENQKELN